MKQPEALRIAELLDDSHLSVHHKAAAELRRLHEVNQELLEALKAVEPYLDRLVCYASTASEYPPNAAVRKANAAIAKAEEQMK